MVILLLACFPQLDVVRNAPAPTLNTSALLSPQEAASRAQKEREFESFSNNVINIMIGVINTHDLKMIAGMINLCLERWDMKTVMFTRVSSLMSGVRSISFAYQPGLALITSLLARGTILKQGAGDAANPAPPSAADIQLW